jgi:hypothetical protein
LSRIIKKINGSSSKKQSPENNFVGGLDVTKNYDQPSAPGVDEALSSSSSSSSSLSSSTSSSNKSKSSPRQSKSGYSSNSNKKK